MKVELSHIHVDASDEGRIREQKNLAKAVTARAASILRFGQLQPILVEAQEGEKPWKLVDGQVRYVSMMALSFRHEQGEEEVVKAFEALNLTPGEIEVTTRDSLSPELSLMMEYHANEDRDNFTWDERARYIRRIHDMHQEKHGRKEWNAGKTAEAIGQSPATVSHYLQLTDKRDPAVQSERVQKATTKGAALKQLKIEKAKNQRKARAAKAAEAEKEGDSGEYAETAKMAVYHGDCREWIKKVPDNKLSWFHWDPPYGGAEGRGGAFVAHERIQTDHDYAITLLLEMLPEIHRTLHDGAWLVLWYTPVHYGLIRLLLQGHRFSSETACCHFCGKHILNDHTWLTKNYSCVKSPFRFWVNPYPNQWRKTDRVADGHEITRFFTKETEPFFLAGKQDAQTPILTRTDRGNVFNFPSVPAEERRHVNHKPWQLIQEILSCISVPGSLGGDAGMGSGSIIEGAINSRRKVIGAEISDNYHEECTAIYTKRLQNRKAGPSFLAPWLEDSFGAQ